MLEAIAINRQASRPIYFGVVIWGKAFCQAFMEHCLLSLLASGNIPALPNTNHQNRFFFSTTSDDWEWLQSHPHFILLSRFITPEFVPIDLISEEAYQKLHSPLAYKFYIVTQGHIALVSKMHQAGSIGSLIFPDTIYAKDALQSVYPKVLAKNKKAVLAHFPRFATPQLLSDLKESGYINPGVSIEIENRDLVRRALRYRNIEVAIQNWKTFYAFNHITDIWFPLKREVGMLCHSLMWCPVFIDYSKMTSHNIACLNGNTIDGSYLYHNFTADDLHVVTDSDEFLMISYSPHENLLFKDEPGIKDRFNNVPKMLYWRKMLRVSAMFVDPLKLKLLKYPIFVHTEDLNSKEYAVRRRSRRLVNRILSKPNRREHTLVWIKKIPGLISSAISWIRAKLKLRTRYYRARTGYYRIKARYNQIKAGYYRIKAKLSITSRLRWIGSKLTSISRLKG